MTKIHWRKKKISIVKSIDQLFFGVAFPWFSWFLYLTIEDLYSGASIWTFHFFKDWSLSSLFMKRWYVAQKKICHHDALMQCRWVTCQHYIGASWCKILQNTINKGLSVKERNTNEFTYSVVGGVVGMGSSGLRVSCRPGGRVRGAGPRRVAGRPPCHTAPSAAHIGSYPPQEETPP